MKRVFLSFIIFSLFAIGCAGNKSQNDQNGWKPLFNGKDIKEWFVKIHHHEEGENFGNTFRVEDGIIKIRYDQYGDFNNQFGHLYYKKPFSYYHLKFEYRFVGELHRGAPSYTLRNSGVMFHSQDPRSMLKEQDWPISVEMQLLGGLSDGKPRPTGNMCSPGTNVVYQGKIASTHCLNSTSKTYDGDQWVKGELIVLGDSLIKHIINGDTVLQYAKPQIGGGTANGYDPKIKIEGKLLSSGFIALQSEGQPVDFKNIWIKELKK
ncbi:DUF1080 domain-containing protein [Sphingobacterium sp. PU5-4]|uniref:DUF1080 domain-containing protein n=1 Tax=Sphingobacterium tenebrionis TaxID=3111775 RepID=A0ABU8I9J2_9SPHI